jgi:hypothetical protein
MAGKKYRGRDGQEFPVLNFKQQAQSINGTLNALEKMVEMNIGRALENGKDPAAVRESRSRQIMRVAARIRGRVEPEN